MQQRNDLTEQPPFDLRNAPGMIRWYQPAFLISTIVRRLIEGFIGQIAIQRHADATVDGAAPEVILGVVTQFDYSDLPRDADGAFWFDYAANVGEGFSPTFAIASLMAADHVGVGGHVLPRSEMLFLGGNQVSPYPNRLNYLQRFVSPYSIAHGRQGIEAKKPLFILPGAVDWFDGLNAFDQMFCNSRFGQSDDNVIGAWTCPQHRSYFAVSLPNGWWVWGTDVRRSSALDIGQRLYFESVAQQLREIEGPKNIVLLIPEADWISDTPHEDVARVVEMAHDAGATVRAVVAGNNQHYSRYQSASGEPQFISSGGGGAYLTATHALPRRSHYEWMRHRKTHGSETPDSQGTARRATWPSTTTSVRLAINVLLFPFRHYGFSVALGILYWMYVWMFSTTFVNGHAVGQTLIQDPNFHWYPGIFLLVPLALATNLMLGVMTLFMWVVLYAYADGSRGAGIKAALGTLHWSAHLAMMISAYYLVSYTSFYLVDEAWPNTRDVLQTLELSSSLDARELLRTIVIFPLIMIFGGAILAGFVWGAYLTLCALIGWHLNDAFATLAIPHYKHFLRFKVEPSRLTIFPVGLRRAPRRWRHGRNRNGEPAIVPSRPLNPILIEDPIVVSA